MAVDNLTLALLSLKNDINIYLDDQGWKRLYRSFLFGDSGITGKELVAKRTKRNQVELPVLIIDTGLIRNEIDEIGTEHGKDFVTLTLIVIAKETNQLRTLANLLRRRMNTRVFDINNFESPRFEKVGTGVISDVFLTDVSDPNADNLGDRHVAVINATLELDAKNLV